MQRLPNLGMLDLHPRSNTGATGDGNQPDPKRQRTTGQRETDEQRDQSVERFVLSKMKDYFGQMPSDPQVVADFRRRVVLTIFEKYKDRGLTMDWPSQLGTTQGKEMLAGKRDSNMNIRKLREDKWTEGIFALKSERDEARRERDLQKKQHIIDNELRDQDASSDGAEFFKNKEPVNPQRLLQNSPLYKDTKKKASGGDQSKWGQDARARAAQGGRRGGCCGPRS